MIRLLFTLALLPLLNADGLAQNSSGLKGKILCGYQGWFRTPNDETGCGWHHYGSGGNFTANSCTIDLWPDVSELPKSDLQKSDFKHQDGRSAYVYSSVKPSVSDLHFRWMKQYDIDGVFLQRFAVSTMHSKLRTAMNKVLKNVISASKKHEREWVLMYDLSGLKEGQANVVMEDWKNLQKEFSITDKEENPNYLIHNKKPLVSLWGAGFTSRKTSLNEWKKLVKFFKKQGCSVMLGIPTYWRTLRRDCIQDPKFHEILEMVDVISPWTVGRYQTPKTAKLYTETTLAKDLDWCKKRNIDLLPVAFPGFSWQNLKRTRGAEAKLNAIPRLKGNFFWNQCRSFHQTGCQMLYVAMFDELDEGTAIMKVTQDPPVGRIQFANEKTTPNDRYLWLAGFARKMYRGEIKLNGPEMPDRKNSTIKQ